LVNHHNHRVPHECGIARKCRVAAQLLNAYKPYPVNSVWLKSSPACHARCNRTIGTNDQHSNAAYAMEALANATVANAAGKPTPDLTVLSRVDINFTTSMYKVIMDLPYEDKVLFPWLMVPQGGVIADTLFVAPGKLFQKFACSICDPKGCLGSCAGSLGVVCSANSNHGHECDGNWKQDGIPFQAMRDDGYWDSDAIKENPESLEGQPFPDRGNPFYSMPLRTHRDDGGHFDSGRQELNHADGDLPEEWADMARAATDIPKLKSLIPLEYLASIWDQRQVIMSENLWRERCNSLYKCGLHADQLPTTYHKPDNMRDLLHVRAQTRPPRS